MHDLGKVYRTHFSRRAVRSLDALTLSVAENEIFGFLGKNGAGKTTTIKILCGLIRPTQGRASIFGEDVRRPTARRMIGYLPENPYFYEYLTPKETLDFYGRLEGLTPKERAAEWDKLSEMLDLREIANQRVRGFSKGMRQRLGFAVALAGDPKVLILDEPMSGLDPSGRRRIRDLILLMRDFKKTIFFSSHVLGDVEQICDRVGILSGGRLTVQGRIDELLARRIHEIEVILRALPEYAHGEVSAMALRTRRSEAGTHYHFAEVATANAAVKRAIEHGGQLVEFTPIKETLEDYFLREEIRSYFSQRDGAQRESAKKEPIA